MMGPPGPLMNMVGPPGPLNDKVLKLQNDGTPGTPSLKLWIYENDGTLLSNSGIEVNY